MQNKNKSHLLAAELKHLSAMQVDINNPFEKLMEDAAKHIEWMELILTGISCKERSTIAKLNRRVNRLEVMVTARDSKLKWMKNQERVLSATHKTDMTVLKNKYDGWCEDLKNMKLEVTDEIREHIEREFVAKLQKRVGKKPKRSYDDMFEQQIEAACPTGGWHKIF